MRKLFLLAVLAFGMNVTAQTFTTTVTAPNLTATEVVRGGTNTTPNNTSLAADFKGSVGITGVLTTTGDVSIVGGRKLTVTGNTELGAPGNSTTLVVNGRSTTINTVTTDINSAKTNTKSIDATGNIVATGVVTGNLGLNAGNGGFTVSNTGVTTATSITAGNIATTGGKINLNGANGNIVTTGVINANGKATIDASNGSIWASGTTTAQGGLKVFNGASIAGGLDMQNGKITKVANGTAATDAVNKGQLDGVQDNLNIEVNRLDARIDTKADKVEVAEQIQDARQQAISISNQYTDEKISEVNDKVDTEVSRLDGRIDATNQTVTNLSNRVTTEVARVDSRIDATNTTVTNLTTTVEAAKATAKVQSNLDIESAARKKADEEIYGSISKTNANLDKEIATRKLEVARLDNRIDNVINYVGNEFKAVNNRIDGLGAMTVALSTAATSSVYNPNKPTNVNFATGYYGRAGALALGVSHFLSSNTKLSVNYAAGSFTKSAVGLGVGFAF